jgi:tetratricopeptide (TPR) repeat protein
LGEAIRLEPTLAAAFLFRGSAYTNRGLSHAISSDLDGAVADFTEAIRLKPTDAEGYLRRAQAYGGKNDHDKAIADSTEAIRLHPRFADAFFCRGIAYQYKQDHQRALSDLTQAISLEPKGVYYQCRAEAYRALGEEGKAAADQLRAQRLTNGEEG